MLRDHPAFRSPRTVPVGQTITITTPDDFRPEITEPKIQVLPLVNDHKVSAHNPGWCTYTYEHDSAHELEVLCGGVNHKTPKAGAVWRQGNLLHFGFEPSPERMNDTGRAMLVNAVCYIARFTEDRPVVRTPCVFVQGTRIFDRDAVARLIANPARDLKDLEHYLDKEAYKGVAGRGREEAGAWFQRVRGSLRADADGKLTVDADAQALGTSPTAADFFERAAAALGEPERAALARRLLGRYASDGPGADATAEQWRAWHRENGAYLFFSDTGGYRWYVDPLAQRRGVPTAQLRGPARATLPTPGAEPGRR